MMEAMTTLEEREVDTFEGLLVDYAMRRESVNAVLRGIRAISDYEFELQMALMNRKMEPRVETVFMMPAETVFLSELAIGARDCATGRIDHRPGSRPWWKTDPRKNRIQPEISLTSQNICYEGEDRMTVAPEPTLV